MLIFNLNNIKSNYSADPSYRCDIRMIFLYAKVNVSTFVISRFIIVTYHEYGQLAIGFAPQ